MEWLLFLSQLPSTPSSLRVMVWRKMRSFGALGLQNGVWLLPDKTEHIRFLSELADTLRTQGASFLVFKAKAANEEFAQEIQQRLSLECDIEYTEFLSDGEEFLNELANETRKERFIFAELEENEQDLERLSNWLERIQRRDYVGAGLAGQAKEMLERCKTAFDTFSAEIYRRAVDDTSASDKPTPEETR